MNFSKFDSILFDLDGTLVDTMELHFVTWAAVLSRLDISLERSFFLRNEGANIHQFMSRVTGIDDRAQVEELVREKDSIFIEQYEFRVFEGVYELIALLQQLELKLGIVTASSAWRLRQTVPAEFLDLFHVVITGDTPGPGKPDPWPYTSAMNELSCVASRSLVIENAPLGIISAKRAGAHCVGICTTLSASYLIGADDHYDSIIDFYLSCKNVPDNR